MLSLISIRRKITRSLRRRGVLGTLYHCIRQPYFLVLEFQPSRIRWRKRDKEFDRQFGVDTAGTIHISALGIDSPAWEHGFDYQATDPEHFETIIGGLPIRHEEFTFIDMGAGKGRVLLLAAQFPFRRIVGVEFSPRLHEVAVRNIRNYRNPLVKCADITSICEDAANYRLPRDPLLLYFFNPFQEAIMTKVLANVEESLRQNPRRVYLIYRTPKLSSLMDARRFLKKVRTEHGYSVYTGT